MKTTIVPAQITTVEDKIAGNLNFTQLLLLTTPIFISGAIFAFIPPFMNLRFYKLILATLITVIFLTLSIRIKGRILLDWFTIVGRYNHRPRYYLYNKNDLHLRDVNKLKQKNIIENKEIYKEVNPVKFKDMVTADIAHLENIITDPRANFHFKISKNGGLRVIIKEIK